jgi:hypothetical protein
MVAQPHASIGPSVEVCLHIDGAAHTLALADGPANKHAMVSSCANLDSRRLSAELLPKKQTGTSGTHQYWLNVCVPSIEGWLYRVV